MSGRTKVQAARLHESIAAANRTPRQCFVSLEVRLTTLEAETLDSVLIGLAKLVEKKLLFIKSDTEEEHEACLSALAKVRASLEAKTEPFD